NAQTLRVVTALERRYPAFDGLNLTWETLEGLVKHNGPLTGRDGKPLGRYRAHGIPETIADYDQRQDLQLWSFPSLEAQVAAIADDIAYDAHDIDDGLRAGLFAIDDLKEIPLAAGIIAEIDDEYPGLDESRRGAELVRELISHFIGAVMMEAHRRLELTRPASAEEVRNQNEALIVFPDETREAEAAIKKFLKLRMYRHERVMRVMRGAEPLVSVLLARYQSDP